MSLSDDQLTEIVRETVGHYDRNALSFWEGTKDHDVSQNTQTLLSNIRGEAPYRILDVGCGPGRDLAFEILPGVTQASAVFHCVCVFR